jgi:D-proline reductase (dithiol) PrdB
VSLIARHLEANGIPTVIIGSAKDIVEVCGVSRFLFVDFPLGNPCGKPDDREMQKRIVSEGLSMFETVTKPETTQVSSELWGSNEWRAGYMRVDESNRDELAQRGAALRIQRQARVPRANT